jgi:hypothetical protein
VFLAKRLVLAHFWVAFVAFVAALVLGEWQMFVRSPLSAWVGDPEHYYRSVTGHGTVMGYVFPTLVAMGFGYAVTALTTRTALRWRTGAWLALALTCIGLIIDDLRTGRRYRLVAGGMEWDDLGPIPPAGTGRSSGTRGPCETCGGAGYKHPSSMVTCATCKGTGNV